MLLIKPLFVIPIVINSLNKKFFIHKTRNMKKIKNFLLLDLIYLFDLFDKNFTNLIIFYE